LLKEYCRAEGVVLPHLSRKRQTFEIDIATLNGELADDTSKTAVAFVRGGSARRICLGGGVAYFLSLEGRQAKFPEGSELVLISNRDRKIPTHPTEDRQQYLIRRLTHFECSMRWSPKASLVCGREHPCSISEHTGKSLTLPLNQLSRRRIESDGGTAETRGMSRPLPHPRFMKI
jgi:hypothetical protein